MKRFYGCHVSASGGMKLAYERGQKLGVNTIQIHPSPPQRYVLQPFAAGLEDGLLDVRLQSGVEKLFFHSIYLINLANPDPEKRTLSMKSLINELDFAARCQAEGVIFHVGSLKDEPHETIGLERSAECIKQILDDSDDRSRLLLEVSAGSGKIIGARIEQLAEIYNHVNNKQRLGFALDTQHMWASGYDWQNELDTIISQVEASFGIENIYAIHLNDSQSKLASKIDRHANLGEGTIGYETLTKIVNHPKLSHIPLILETPRMKNIDEAQIEVLALNKMLGL
jgi:deoxyribonuclease-4